MSQKLSGEQVPQGSIVASVCASAADNEKSTRLSPLLLPLPRLMPGVGPSLDGQLHDEHVELVAA